MEQSGWEQGRRWYWQGGGFHSTSPWGAITARREENPPVMGFVYFGKAPSGCGVENWARDQGENSIPLATVTLHAAGTT